MAEFKINHKVSLSNSPLTKLLQNPYNPNQLISTYFSGLLHVWKLPTLKQHRKVTLPLSKLTSFVPFQNSKSRGFLLGVRNGELMIVKDSFQVISSMRLHQESISEIIVSSQSVITVGMDGQVIFSEKETLEQVKKVNLQEPLFSAVQFQNQLFVSSIKSFVINLETYQWNQGKRFDRFFLIRNRLYGSSDQRGLSCINSNSNNYLPAEFILLYQRKLVIFSEKSICVADQISKLEYKAKKCHQLSTGESITTGFVCEGNIYVGGNEGNIYWITQSLEKQPDPLF